MTPASGEFAIFARYLGVRKPALAMQEYYRAAVPRLAPHAMDPFDAELLRFAARGPMRAALADAYARNVRPHGVLRRRLVLVLAILESAPPSAASMHEARPRAAPLLLLGLTLLGLRAVVVAVAATALLGPLQLVHAVRDHP